MFAQLGSPETEQDITEAGGKAASLSRLCREGLPVPRGFVVPASAGEADASLGATLRLVAAAMDGPNPPQPETLLRQFPALRPVAAVLRRELNASVDAWPQPAPRWFIVRSSATHEDSDTTSFAGVLESFPAVRGPDLAAAVLLCRAAAYRRRALAYCKKNGLDPGEIAVAAVVQEMVEARASGVLLTRDPVSGEQALVINAVYGLGSTLVDGEADPDCYRRRADGAWEARRGSQSWKEVLTRWGVRRRPLADKERRQAVLTPAQREALAELGERVEQSYGAPQDLEWAIDGERLWLLQARPITTLPEPSGVWTRANLIELYPEVVSPMTASLIERIQGRWLADYFLRCGFAVGHLGPGMRVIRGRAYFNQTLIHWMATAAGIDPERVHEGLGGGSDASGNDRWDWRQALRNAGPFLRLFRRYLTAPRRAPAVLGCAAREAEQRRPHADLSDRELLAGAVACFQAQRVRFDLTTDIAGAIHVCRGLANVLLRGNGEPPADGESASAAFARELDALIEEARAEPAAAAALMDADDLSLRLLERLDGTRFGRQFRGFLERHGFRALYESDSAVPRYREDPAPLLCAVRRGLEGEPPVSTPRADGAHRDAGAAVRGVSLPGRLLLRHLGRLYALRQDVRAAITSLIADERCWELALGERWAARGWLDKPEDYFALTVADAERAVCDPGPEPGRWLRERVARNRAQCDEWAAVSMPLTWTSEAAGTAGSEAPAAEPGERLQGIPISPGVVEGRVTILRRPEEARSIPPGAILVSPLVGSAWAPLYARAAGLVVEVGGLLSHGSILAREYGLPAVANVSGVTTTLRDGEWVRVDGTRGIVYRLEEAGEPAQGLEAPRQAEALYGEEVEGIETAPGSRREVRRSLWVAVAGLLVYLLVGTTGDLLLKHGMGLAAAPQDSSLGEVLRLARHIFTTPEVGLGVFLLATNFAMLLAVLTSADVSVVGPARALGYLFLTGMAALVLHEQISPLRWAGVLLITIGVAVVLSTHEERVEAPAPDPEQDSKETRPARARVHVRRRPA